LQLPTDISYYTDRQTDRQTDKQAQDRQTIGIIGVAVAKTGPYFLVHPVIFKTSR